MDLYAITFSLIILTPAFLVLYQIKKGKGSRSSIDDRNEDNQQFNVNGLPMFGGVDTAGNPYGVFGHDD